MIAVSPIAAGPFHAAVLARLHGRCFAEPWNETALTGLLTLPSTLALIATDRADDDAPRGFILLQSAADEAEIVTLCVLPEWQGQGVGRALIDAAIDHLRRRGVITLFLEVAVDNAPARALYRRCGFIEAGRRAEYYARPGGSNVDALILRLTFRRGDGGDGGGDDRHDDGCEVSDSSG